MHKHESCAVTNKSELGCHDPNVEITVIEGYLNEAKLALALKAIVPNGWSGTQVPVADTRCRWDMSFELEARTTVVEFDGPDHYRDPLKLKTDRAKDEMAHRQGFRIVRFPYWVQLDDLTLRHYFGLTAQIDQSFPHGFITTKWFPASFCELGIERFKTELGGLPSRVRDAVVLSLRDRVQEHGLEYVLPKCLHDLL